MTDQQTEQPSSTDDGVPIRLRLTVDPDINGVHIRPKLVDDGAALLLDVKTGLPTTELVDVLQITARGIRQGMDDGQVPA